MATPTLTYRTYGTVTLPAARASAAAVAPDLDPLFTALSADASGFWEVAGKDIAGTHRYFCLRRKNGSPGRIFFVLFGGSVTVTNPEYRIYAGNGVVAATNGISSNVSTCVVIYAPNSVQNTLTIDTNLSLDNYTNMVFGTSVAAAFLSSGQSFMLLQTQDSVFISAGTSSAAGTVLYGAGEIFESGSGDAVPGIVTGAGDIANLASAWLWSSSTGVTTSPFRSRVNGTIRNCGITLSLATGYHPAVFSFTTTSTQKAVFLPFTQSVVEFGPPDPDTFQFLKLRQVAFGRPRVSPLETISDASGVIATAMNPAPAGSIPALWATNFKV